MKIVVTGGGGLVGYALKMIECGADQLVYHTRNDCDLCELEPFREFLSRHSPDCVIHLAARVLNRKIRTCI